MPMAERIQTELEAFSTDLCRIFGGCSGCSGYAPAGECGLVGEIDADELVFCTHWCHKVGGTN